jgi:hypothetical protein
MKYLITESQIDKVVFKYLDNQDFVKDATSKEIFFLNSINDEQGIMVFDKKKGMLYISFELVNEIAEFFSIHNVHSSNLITDWAQGNIDQRIRLNYIAATNHRGLLARSYHSRT